MPLTPDDPTSCEARSSQPWELELRDEACRLDPVWMGSPNLDPDQILRSATVANADYTTHPRQSLSTEIIRRMNRENRARREHDECRGGRRSEEVQSESKGVELVWSECEECGPSNLWWLPTSSMTFLGWFSDLGGFALCCGRACWRGFGISNCYYDVVLSGRAIKTISILNLEISFIKLRLTLEIFYNWSSSKFRDN